MGDNMNNELDKLGNGLEQYNASIDAALEKKNDTQPLTGYQVPEESPYQAYDKPVEEQPAFLWKAFQQAKETWEKSLRKRSEEDAKLLATERPDFDYPDEKRAYLEKWGRV